MKKIKIFLTLLISLIFIPIMVNAASGKISVSSTSTVVVGNKVTVTVTLSGSDIGSWQMTLNYDKNYLQLTNSSAEAGGAVMSSSVAKAISSKKYTFTFKTLKKGSTTVSVKSYEAYAFSDMKEIDLTSSSKTIKIITQDELEASYSKDNNLKSLSVEGYELDKAFDKNVQDYVVNVNEGTTSVKINAVASDNKASVSGAGDITVTAGANVIKIIVRAENGSEKTYTLTINVIDQNPINVTVDDKDYTVIKLRDNYECPNSFSESTVKINDFDIPSCYNDNLDYQLVGLKLSDGTIENFIYTNNSYTKYVEAIGTSIKLIIIDYNDELDGLTKYEEEIDGVKYNVFKTDENSKYYVVYGINVETGKKDLYSYDSVSKTFSLYNKVEAKEIKDLSNLYLYVIIAFGACLFLSIICVISLLSKINRMKKINIELRKENVTKQEKLEEEMLKEEKTDKIEDKKKEDNKEENKEKNTKLKENKNKKKKTAKSKKEENKN